MYAEERHAAILQRVSDSGRVEVTGLAEELAVTQETVRRDLTVLERRGLLKRVHGGAVPLERIDYEARLSTRRERNAEEKARIARVAAAEIPDEGAVLFDSGSTPEETARAMPTDRELTVVTNSLPIAIFLADLPALSVWTVGGRVRGRTHAAVDEWARRQLEDVSVEVAFLGTNGVTVARGLTTPQPTEAAAKQAMVQAARRRILVCDHTKFGRNSFCRFADVADIDLVITGAEVDDDTVAEIEAAGPKVIRA